MEFIVLLIKPWLNILRFHKKYTTTSLATYIASYQNKFVDLLYFPRKEYHGICFKVFIAKKLLYEATTLPSFLRKHTLSSCIWHL